jgi:hypothetical protein
MGMVMVILTSLTQGFYSILEMHTTLHMAYLQHPWRVCTSSQLLHTLAMSAGSSAAMELGEFSSLPTAATAALGLLTPKTLFGALILRGLPVK